VPPTAVSPTGQSYVPTAITRSGSATRGKPGELFAQNSSAGLIGVGQIIREGGDNSAHRRQDERMQQQGITQIVKRNTMRDLSVEQTDQMGCEPKSFGTEPQPPFPWPTPE